MTSRTTTGATVNGLNNHYYSSSSLSSSPSIKGCCCCLFLLFSFLALLALAVVLVIVLAVKPKKPQFDLQQVGVQYVGITANPAASAATAAAAASSASLSLNIRLLFTAANPNKVGIKYGESKFTVMYRGIPLGEGIVPGFFQPAHSVRQVETIVSVDRVNLQQADASDLVRDASLNDRVELRVLGDVRAKIRLMSFDSPSVQIRDFSTKQSPQRTTSSHPLNFFLFSSPSGSGYGGGADGGAHIRSQRQNHPRHQEPPECNPFPSVAQSSLDFAHLHLHLLPPHPLPSLPRLPHQHRLRQHIPSAQSHYAVTLLCALVMRGSPALLREIYLLTRTPRSGSSIVYRARN